MSPALDSHALRVVRVARRVRVRVRGFTGVRDRKPNVLHRVKIFVCNKCSLEFSESLAATHKHSVAAALCGPTADPPAPPQPATTRPPLEEVPEEDPRTEAEIRKSLSLPLLKPKLDRAKMAKSRPWRQAKEEDGPVDEAPRFKPIAALSGVQPKPDPRYLPSLQVKLDAEAARKRRVTAREVGLSVREANALASQQTSKASAAPSDIFARGGGEGGGWEVDEGDSFFLTASASQPDLSRHKKYVAPQNRQRVGGKLPHIGLSDATLGGGRARDVHLPEVVAQHRGALKDVAASHGVLDQQLASLNARMASLQGSMQPVRKAARKREKALVLASEERLNSALIEIRTSLLRELPKVVDLFQRFDRNADGHIARDEFCEVLPLLKLPNYGMAEMHAFFDVIDTDRSGTIEYTELHKLLRKGAEIELAKALQAGAKGRIEVEARGRYAVRKSAHEGALMAPQKEATVETIKAAMIKAASRVVDFFRHLDSDGDGNVTRAEFRSALPLLGFGAGGRGAIDSLFDSLDTNGNGTIEYEELAAVLRRDDVAIAAELQAGAMGEIETSPKNQIALRRDVRDGVSAPLKEATLSSMRQTLASNMAKVSDLLSMLDVNSDGIVSRAEFRTAMPLIGFGAGGRQAIDSLFDSLDLNKDGGLDYGELKAQLMGSAPKVVEPPT